MGGTKEGSMVGVILGTQASAPLFELKGIAAQGHQSIAAPRQGIDFNDRARISSKLEGGTMAI